MRYALVNPPWSFEGSIYFGCREPHLPLELAYSKALLEKAGHTVKIVDGHLNGLSLDDIVGGVKDFRPDFAVVTTAPSYLFWRCAPPELRVPRQTIDALRGIGCTLVAVGPHGSTTARTTLTKLGVDVVVMGECEEVLPNLSDDWSGVQSICYRSAGEICIQGGRHAVNMDGFVVVIVVVAIVIIIIVSIERHMEEAQRWKRPVDVRISARFARRKISAIRFDAGPWT